MTATGWTWASATVRGTSHVRAGTRRQDAYRCFVPTNASSFLVCVVSDGAGSASHGGEGASLVCRTMSMTIQGHLAATGSLPGDECFSDWLDVARDRISSVAARRALTSRDFAATMIAVVSDGHRTLVAQVGDGCAVLQELVSKAWRIPLWPDHGEYASTTTFVTDQPDAKCRIWREQLDITSVAAFSDGLERLVIDFTSKEPHAGFFDAMTGPVLASAATGRDLPLSTLLKRYLESDAICARTDDDKTLVIATRK